LRPRSVYRGVDEDVTDAAGAEILGLGLKAEERVASAV
jgi:hypothetical protein